MREAGPLRMTRRKVSWRRSSASWGGSRRLRNPRTGPEWREKAAFHSDGSLLGDSSPCIYISRDTRGSGKLQRHRRAPGAN